MGDSFGSHSTTGTDSALQPLSDDDLQYRTASDYVVHSGEEPMNDPFDQQYLDDGFRIKDQGARFVGVTVSSTGLATFCPLLNSDEIRRFISLYRGTENTLAVFERVDISRW